MIVSLHSAPKPRQQSAPPVNNEQAVIVPHVNHIHLLRRTSRCIWVKQPHRDTKYNVQHEDEIRLPANVSNGYRRDLDDEVVEDPVAGGGKGGCMCAVAKRHELRAVDPGDWEPANGKYGLEEEEEGQRRF